MSSEFMIYIAIIEMMIVGIYGLFLVWLGSWIQKQDHRRLKETHDKWVKAMRKAGFTSV